MFLDHNKLNVIAIKAEKLIDTLLRTNQEILAESRRNDWRVTDQDLVMLGGLIGAVHFYAVASRGENMATEANGKEVVTLLQKTRHTLEKVGLKSRPYAMYPLWEEVMALYRALLYVLEPSAINPAAEFRYNVPELDAMGINPAQVEAALKKAYFGQPEETAGMSDDIDAIIGLAADYKMGFVAMAQHYGDADHPIFTRLQFAEEVIAGRSGPCYVSGKEYWLWVKTQIHDALVKADVALPPYALSAKYTPYISGTPSEHPLFTRNAWQAAHVSQRPDTWPNYWEWVSMQLAVAAKVIREEEPTKWTHIDVPYWERRYGKEHAVFTQEAFRQALRKEAKDLTVPEEFFTPHAYWEWVATQLRRSAK